MALCFQLKVTLWMVLSGLCVNIVVHCSSELDRMPLVDRDTGIKLHDTKLIRLVRQISCLTTQPSHLTNQSLMCSQVFQLKKICLYLYSYHKYIQINSFLIESLKALDEMETTIVCKALLIQIKKCFQN